MDIDIKKFVGANAFYLIFIADEEKAARVCAGRQTQRREFVCVRVIKHLRVIANKQQEQLRSLCCWRGETKA